jgi:hypothetical protein
MRGYDAPDGSVPVQDRRDLAGGGPLVVPGLPRIMLSRRQQRVECEQHPSKRYCSVVIDIPQIIDEYFADRGGRDIVLNDL